MASCVFSKPMHCSISTCESTPTSAVCIPYKELLFTCSFHAQSFARIGRTREIVPFSSGCYKQVESSEEKSNSAANKSVLKCEKAATTLFALVFSHNGSRLPFKVKLTCDEHRTELIPTPEKREENPFDLYVLPDYS